MMPDVGLWVGDGECCGVLVGVLLIVVGVGLWWCVFGVLVYLCVLSICVCCVLCIVYCVLCVIGALCCDVVGCALLVFVLSSWPNG